MTPAGDWVTGFAPEHYHRHDDDRLTIQAGGRVEPDVNAERALINAERALITDYRAALAGDANTLNSLRLRSGSATSTRPHSRTTGYRPRSTGPTPARFPHRTPRPSLLRERASWTIGRTRKLPSVLERE
ncbi:hypothetical protein C1I63_02615 [Rathayibacter caricis DSM 15933]|uniref:Uncharacterized protein n=1 Tax=Rathayibacter caricis DSM 15933 TaxID=1328867 RepID=A0A2T4UQS6_9MICO|nr:hypothetical protein C1I63_02615 [Rathayibacter caricis DSM 15933]